MATEGGPNIVYNGLIAYLDAGNKNSYPGSGTSWVDITNNRNNGTLVNGPTFSNDKGGCIVFDGTDDVTNIGTASSYLPLQSHALEIWFKSSGIASGMNAGGLIFIHYGLAIRLISTGIFYYVYSTDSGYPGVYIVNDTTYNQPLIDNKWHHVVCTLFNNSSYGIYVDGVISKSGSPSASWSGNSIWSGMSSLIGSDSNDVYYYLKGSVAISRIYNRGLTASEVLQNYNATKTRFGL